MDGTAGLHTWSNKVMSDSIAPLGACSNIVAEALSPSAVGSCCCSSQQGGTGLELGVGLPLHKVSEAPPRTLSRQLLLGGDVQASIQKKA